MIDRMIDCWKPTDFYRATSNKGPVVQWGYGYRGMILHNTGWKKPLTRTLWSLIHRGSGGTVMWLTGTIATVFPVAKEIAEACDWTAFDLPDGWRQIAPDLPEKVSAIILAHPEAKPYNSDRKGMVTITREDALAVIEAREAMGQAALNESL